MGGGTRTAGRRLSTETVAAWSAMAAVTAFVVWQLHPELIVRNTTPAQGDLGGHLHEADYLRHHLLPRLSGWSQDWYTGYPSLTFYFPLGSLLTALLSALLPLNVAFKLVAATGPATLPLAAYAFGRLHGRDRLASACLGVSVLPLLLQRDLFQAGGSIASAVVGEYGYGLSLSASLVVLGLVGAGFRTGRHRAPAAALLAVALLFHLLPTALVFIGIAVSLALAPSWARVRWAASVVGGAVLLAGFWLVPFVLRGRFTTGPDYPKAGPLSDWLLPNFMLPVAVLALIGLFVSATDENGQDRFGAYLFVMAVAAAALFAVVPTGRAWNVRFLPLWFLCLCLLMGQALQRAVEALANARRRTAQGPVPRFPRYAHAAVPLVALLAMLPLWDTRLGKGLLTRSGYDLTNVARQFFEGRERSPRRAEYAELVDTFRAIGRDRGCGRAHWEWENGDWSDTRAALVLLLPYWTDGCIRLTEGLYAQSAATSLYIHATNARLSTNPLTVAEEQPLFDLAAGLADLRLLGVRYFFTSSATTQEQADASPELRLLGQTKPYEEDRFWKVYELSDVSLVEPLGFTPVVASGIGRSRRTWEREALAWYGRGQERDVVAAADGPSDWPRTEGLPKRLPRRPVAGTTVSGVRLTDDSVSFSVSRPGTPVLVKVSYFPNWKAHGARGPWRVTPNQMVVIPTSSTVRLTYGWTAVEALGWLATALGVAAVILMARRGAVELPATAEPATPERARPRPAPVRRRRGSVSTRRQRGRTRR